MRGLYGYHVKRSGKRRVELESKKTEVQDRGLARPLSTVPRNEAHPNDGQPLRGGLPVLRREAVVVHLDREAATPVLQLRIEGKDLDEFGTPKSGHWKHAGIPGHRGGSARNDEPGTTRVGITSYSTGLKYTSVHAVYRDMESFTVKLKEIDGVSNVSVKFGTGVWEGGREPSWVVSYKGNGKAMSLIAQTAKDKGQDGVLILRPPMEGNAHPIIEMEFEERVKPDNKRAILNTVTSEGLGLTWYTKGGKQALFVSIVPEFGNKDEQMKVVSDKIRKTLADLKLKVSYREGAVSTLVLGPDSYDKYIHHESIPAGGDEVLAIFFKLKKKSEATQLEYGVRGKSGHWKHQSQPGHRGGSLPKDGQLSLSLDTPSPQMKAPSYGPEATRILNKISVVVDGSPGQYLKVSQMGFDAVTVAVQKVLSSVPDEWLSKINGVEIEPGANRGWASFDDTWDRVKGGIKNVVRIYPDRFLTGADNTHLHLAGLPPDRKIQLSDLHIVIAHEMGHAIYTHGLSSEDRKMFNDWQEKTKTVYGLTLKWKIARAYGLEFEEYFTVNMEAYMAGRTEFISPPVLTWFDKHMKRQPRIESTRLEYGTSKSGFYGHSGRPGERGGSRPAVVGVVPKGKDKIKKKGHVSICPPEAAKNFPDYAGKLLTPTEINRLTQGVPESVMGRMFIGTDPEWDAYRAGNFMAVFGPTKIPGPPGIINTNPKERAEREGNCYQMAANFVLDNKDWSLCHATLYPRSGQFEDYPYFHAFAVKGELVFDGVVGEFYDKKDYFRYFTPTDIRTYTYPLMAGQMLKTKSWGSWE